MRNFAWVVLCCCLHPGVWVLASDTVGNEGTLVSKESCPVQKMSYEQFIERSRTGYEHEMQSAAKIGITMPPVEKRMATIWDHDTFEKRMAHRGYECLKIMYLSDGRKVVGYLFKPENTAGKKLPVIIFNRGGHAELGKVIPEYSFLYDYVFLEEGFIIIASQYRGMEGGEGNDEFGGKDVHDVVNLIPLVRSLDYADPNNIFMYGFSRGGMMTYLAMKNGAPINAAVVSGGPVDLPALGRLRPEMAKNYAELVPGYNSDPAGTMSQRSAIDWPEKINTPVLLLHGTADWRVPTTDPIRLAMRLQELHKQYALQIYADDVHGLPLHNEEVHHRIVDWFRQYMK